MLDKTPLQAAMLERGIYPGPLTPPMSGDEFVARVAGLPLAFQPGEEWLYDTGIDLLGVLLARETDQAGQRGGGVWAGRDRADHGRRDRVAPHR